MIRARVALAVAFKNCCLQTGSYDGERKRGQIDCDMSEPEFLISVMNRHPVGWRSYVLWAAVRRSTKVRPAFRKWIRAVEARFPYWEGHVSAFLRLGRRVFEALVSLYPTGIASGSRMIFF